MLLRTSLVLASAAFLAFPGTSLAEPSHVGKAGCTSCHKMVGISWEMSAHARAFDSLKRGVKSEEKARAKLDPGKDYTKDEKCVGCHVTGYQKEGGFKDEASTPEMAGISCESCHGPGSQYKVLHDEKKAGFTKEEARAAGETYPSQDPTICTSCHLGKDSPFTEAVDKRYKFDVQKALDERKGLHKKESAMKDGARSRLLRPTSQ